MKTLKIFFAILALFFTFLSGNTIAGTDGAPIKPDNRLVCSDCAPLENVSIKGADFHDAMRSRIPAVNLTGLMFVTPKEASFEDESLSSDTLMLKALKFVVPSEAGFNDEAPIMTFDFRRLAPRTPLNAGFEDIR